MRRGKHYTVPGPSIRETPQEEYAKVASKWSIWSRFFLWLSSVLQGRSFTTLAKRKMIAEIAGSVVGEEPNLYDIETDMVGETLIQVVTQLKNHCRTVRTAVDAILWPEPYGYLRFLIAHLLPEVDQKITVAMKYDFDFGQITSTPVADAVEIVSERVQQEIRRHNGDIVKTLTPHWRCAALLHAAVTMSYDQVLEKAAGPAGNRTIPLKTVVPNLIRLDQMRRQFDRYWQPQTSDYIADYSRNVQPLRPGQIELVVSSVQSLEKRGHVQELIQIGMEDPLLKLSSPPVLAEWFEHTLDAYLGQIWPYLARRASRTCRGEIQSLLLQDYETDITELPQIPPALSTISLGIMCVLSGNKTFANVQRAALQLVIDGVFSRNDGRSMLHQAMTGIEAGLKEVSELFLPDEDGGPGVAWDYIAKIESSAGSVLVSRAKQQEYFDSLHTKLMPIVVSFGEGLIRASRVITARRSGTEEFGTITYDDDLTIQGVKNPRKIDAYLEVIERSWLVMGTRIINLLNIEIEKEPR